MSINSQGKDKLLRKLKSYADKNIILSTLNVDDLIDEFFPENESSEDEEDNFDELVGSLLENGLIYKFGDKDSYLSCVRSHGKISLTEKQMISELKKRNVIFRDNEFPLNRDGSYNIPINTQEYNNLVNNGLIASIDENPKLSLFDSSITAKIVEVVTTDGKCYYYIKE